MARIRTIKPEFWKHEELSALPEPTHMLAGALLNYADDEGYFNANPALVKAECCPLREPSVSVPDSLKSLSKMGYIQLGSTPDGKRYGRIVKFDEHQRVNRPTPSKIKTLGVVWEASPTTHTQITEASPPEGKGKEGNREGEQGTGNRETSSLRSDSASADADASRVASLKAKKAERLRTVTVDAIEAYNRILGKPNGELPSVSLRVGFDKRARQVGRCVKVARDICATLYAGDTTITPAFWQAYFESIADDPFRSGRQKPGVGHENWKPNFEYLTREAVMLDVFDRSGAGDRSAA